MLAQEPEQRQQRQPEDGGVLAFDALEQVDPASLQPIGADRGGHLAAFRGQIRIQEAVAELPHRETRLDHMMPHALPVPQTHDRRRQRMGATAQRPKLDRRPPAHQPACRTIRRHRPESGRRRSPAPPDRPTQHACAFSSASVRAASAALAPSALAVRLTSASSTRAGWTAKVRPAARSTAWREADALARISRGAGRCSIRASLRTPCAGARARPP